MKYIINTNDNPPEKIKNINKSEMNVRKKKDIFTRTIGRNKIKK